MVGPERIGAILRRVSDRFVPSGTCDCGHGFSMHLTTAAAGVHPQRCVSCRCNAFFPATWLPR